MTRVSMGMAFKRIVALAIAFVAATLVALAIAPGTAQAAGPTVPIQPSEAESSCEVITRDLGDGRIEYSASPGEGWQFDYWDVRRADGSTYYTSAYTIDVAEGSIVTAAVFKKGSVTPPTAVINPSGAGTVTVELVEGNAARYTATPAEGWKFSFWTTEWNEGASVEGTDNPTFSLPLESLKSITANFEKVTPTTTYKITVTDDGNGTAEASVAEAAAGEKVTLTATPKDRSFVFDKWVTEDVTIEGDAFVMPEKNVTVKATFKEAPAPVATFAITFDANGGTGTMDALTAEAGTEVALTANAFTRDGYTFNGWNTAKDGSGTAYADKASVKVEGDMTLYAQWKANSSTPSNASGKAPKTGDSAMPIAAGVILAAIAACMLLVARRKLG